MFLNLGVHVCVYNVHEFASSKILGAIKFHETHEIRFFCFCAFHTGTHRVSLWQIRIVLNNWVCVIVRHMEGLQKLLS